MWETGPFGKYGSVKKYQWILRAGRRRASCNVCFHSSTQNHLIIFLQTPLATWTPFLTLESSLRFIWMLHVLAPPIPNRWHPSDPLLVCTWWGMLLVQSIEYDLLTYLGTSVKCKFGSCSHHCLGQNKLLWVNLRSLCHGMTKFPHIWGQIGPLKGRLGIVTTATLKYELSMTEGCKLSESNPDGKWLPAPPHLLLPFRRDLHLM